MSITNIIINDSYTIMQGVNGICLYQEKWMKCEEHEPKTEQTDCNDQQNSSRNPLK